MIGINGIHGHLRGVHVRLNDAFLEHLKYRPPEVFCPEPVHPNMTWHMVIAWELYRKLAA